jgi:hypothetical protein
VQSSKNQTLESVPYLRKEEANNDGMKKRWSSNGIFDFYQFCMHSKVKIYQRDIMMNDRLHFTTESVPSRCGDVLCGCQISGTHISFHSHLFAKLIQPFPSSSLPCKRIRLCISSLQFLHLKKELQGNLFLHSKNQQQTKILLKWAILYQFV